MQTRNAQLQTHYFIIGVFLFFFFLFSPLVNLNYMNTLMKIWQPGTDRLIFRVPGHLRA